MRNETMQVQPEHHDSMEAREDCHKLLLDLICYEIYSKHLSPEMEFLLDEHLDACPTCRERVTAFRRLMPSRNVVRNFG